MDPITEFLQEYGSSRKTAAPMFRRIAESFPEQLAQGAATAGAGALIAGAGIAAHSIYGAVTKARDFRKMLSFNEDLAARHKQNPKYINAAFSTLRSVNPQFSSDPMVAGSFIRNIVESPEGAFGAAGQAAQYAPRFNALQEAALGGLQSGIAPANIPGRGRFVAELHAQSTPQRIPTYDAKAVRTGERTEDSDEIHKRFGKIR